MVWRDLDIYLVAEDIPVSEFFRLGWQIADLLNPTKMQFRNERVARTEGLPHGLYWGVYLGNEHEGVDDLASFDVYLQRVKGCSLNA